VSGPLAVCGWPMGDYNILRSWLLSEKIALETYVKKRPCPTHHMVLGRGLPTVIFIVQGIPKYAFLHFFHDTVPLSNFLLYFVTFYYYFCLHSLKFFFEYIH
jgi:hypothetical protein